MGKIKVEFWGGTSRLDDSVGVNYMITKLEDHEQKPCWEWLYDEDELYAEIKVDTNLDEFDVDNYGYDELKAEIIRQAKELGIDQDKLVFPM